MSSPKSYFIGVDVGTGSARAGLVDLSGKVLRQATCPIRTWNPKPHFYQQSSEDIWNSCCTVIKKVTDGVSSEDVKGIGFDATCSLVVLDDSGLPLTVSPTGESEQNIILWMDHRAEEEANFINSLGHPLLRTVGGRVSLEMEIPKLLWLKKNMFSQTWSKAGKYFDLPDFLTWKATGSESRSLCSLVCKWLYEVTPQGKKQWNPEFMQQIGLEDLLKNNAQKIGVEVREPGAAVDGGLSRSAADALGLREGTPVATSIIDAHAGGLGLIATHSPSVPAHISSRICLICGTSTCHMAVCEDAVFVRGVWGPYFSAMVPGLWLNEAGQSATGKLIDHIISTHPAFVSIHLPPGKHIVEYLNSLLERMAGEKGVPIDFLTKELHVWPDFHGNRSPVADPTLKGMISGLDLSPDERQLALIYLATIQALAYGTKHIIGVLSDSGYREFSAVLVCGGLSKNRLFLETQASVCGTPVLVPEETESVLLGAAILGATASGTFPSVIAAAEGMAGRAVLIPPQPGVQRGSRGRSPSKARSEEFVITLIYAPKGDFPRHDVSVSVTEPYTGILEENIVNSKLLKQVSLSAKMIV